MSLIYHPKGRASEYCPWALNLYKWCPGGCRYCYAPGALHIKAQDYHIPFGPVRPLPTLARELDNLVKMNNKDPVFLSFIGDPWPKMEPTVPFYMTRQVRNNTHQVLQEFLADRVPIRTLTKSPTSAVHDLDVLQELDAEFGVSLVWMDDFKRAEWEPGADSVNDRLWAMRQVHEYGIRTWASIEPVIEPAEALTAIQALSDAGVQNFKIGKLNYLETPAPVDWVNFREMAKDLCKSLGRSFLIKKDLENITESRVTK